MKKVLYALTFAVLLSLAASARSLYWERIDVDLKLNPDATVNVVEKQEYVFGGAWNGGMREISKKGLDSISKIELWEGERRYEEGSLDKYHYTVENSNRLVTIKWRSRQPDEPEYDQTHKTFTLKYVVAGLPTDVNRNTDEIYWKAIFEERDGVVNQATCTLHFPADVSADQLKVTLYTSATDASWRLVDPQTLYFSGKAVAPGELFEVKADFPAGLIIRQFSLKKYFFRHISPYIPFVIPALAFIIMLIMYFRFGRDYEVRGVPRMIGQPPSELSPAIAGTMIDESTGLKEVVATIVDLARRGYLTINEQVSKEWVFTSRDYELVLKKESAGLINYDREIIEKLFGGSAKIGEKIKLSDLHNKFYSYLGEIQDQMFKAAVKLGFFDGDPKAVSLKYYLVGGILAVVGIVLAVSENFIFAPVGVGLGVSGVVVVLFGPFMPRKTLKGSKEKEGWLAFKRFLTDEARTDEFEQYLPYAIAFGVEKKFLNKFKQTSLPAPLWYHSSFLDSAGVVHSSADFGGGRSGGAGAGRSFTISEMSHGLSSFVTDSSSTLSSSPSSSGSGGGSGGGGGGGGGGW